MVLSKILPAPFVPFKPIGKAVFPGSDKEQGYENDPDFYRMRKDGEWITIDKVLSCSNCHGNDEKAERYSKIGSNNQENSAKKFYNAGQKTKKNG